MSCNAMKPLLLAATLLAASVSQAYPKDGVIYTVNYPLQYFQSHECRKDAWKRT